MQNSQTDINNGWKSYKLGELGEYLNGRAFKSADWEKTGLPIIRIQNLNDKEAPFNYSNEKCEERYRVDNGELLVAWSASLGSYIWDRGPGWLNQHIFKVLPNENIVEKRLLYYAIKNIIQDLYAQAHGSGMVHVTKPVFEAQTVMIPEDKRDQSILVNRFDEMFESVEVTTNKLQKSRKLLQLFRQSVLSAAVTGKLTEDWRKSNTEIEDAKSLLLRIKRWKIERCSSSSIREKIDKSYFEAQTNSDFDIELPNSWAYCKIDHIGQVVNGSTPSRKFSEYWKGDIPWVSSGEVKNNYIDNTREKITKDGYNHASVKLLPKGTVLLAMIGEGKTRGQTSILNIEATTNQNIAAIIIDHGLVAPEYLWYWFRMQYLNTRNYGSGSGPQALSCTRVKELPFVLPPLLEQLEIIKRVNKMFGITDQVEKQIDVACNKTNRLTQSILAKAFRGEL